MKLAIIPARGGSKRIPRKNIKLFNGKPIITYSIEAALNSGVFDEVMVSTDDEEIAEIALESGAVVPILRSTGNSDDFATTSNVLEEVLSYYQGEKINITSCCCIYPTAPLISSEDLFNAFELFEKSSFDVLISSVKFSFPIQRAFQVSEKSDIQLIHPDAIKMRSQDLPSTYHDAGAFYLFNPIHFLKVKDLWKGKVGAYELPESRVQDIDTLEDWKIAELKFNLLK